MGVVDALGQWSVGSGGLYLRLARALRMGIERGDIPAGTRLPAERSLARAVAVSRSTVVAAYDMLREEGLLESRQGSGTWVPARAAVQPVERRATHVVATVGTSSVFRSLLEPAAGTIHLTVACAPSLPMVGEEAAQVAADPASVDAAAPLGYAPLGLPVLRAAIAARLTASGLPTSDDQIIVTSGAQQAIALATSLFVRPGEPMIVENPTYPGAIDAMGIAGARVVPLPLDDNGPRPEVLRDVVARTAPRAMYLVPTYQNPTGSVLPDVRRHEIVAISEEYGVPIVEDATPADLSLDDELPPPPMAAFRGGAHVLTIGSMSKLFWGGLRIGWIRAPEHVVTHLARIKIAMDLSSPIITQLIAARLVGRTDEAAAQRRAELAPRARLLCRLLSEHLPDWTWREPRGGLFVWARVPYGDASELAQVALRHGVEIVPGSTMSPDGSHGDRVRLPFVLEPAELEEAIERLARAWRAYSPGAEPRRARIDVLV